MKKALVFPGQGSQSVGMGKALADQFPEAKAVFDEVDEALGETLSAIIFEGPSETLTLTQNAQPAIMATSIAALRVFEKQTGQRVSDADFVAGHSLGEYSALCAAGSLSLADTARLLRLRGQAMQDAVPPGLGAMAALIGVDFETAEAIASEAAGDRVCGIANDNAPGQVVISGHKTAIDRALPIAKDKGAKRALLLDVSAPFHCSLMQPAAKVMQDALAEVKWSAPAVPVVTNMTASAETDPNALRELLVQQVTGMVRWRESVAYLAQQGVEHALEIGAGKVLSGLARRIAPEIQMQNIGEPGDFEVFAKAS